MRNQLPYRWRRRLAVWIRDTKTFYEKLSFRSRFLQDDLYEFNRKATPFLHVFSILLGVAVFVSLLTPLLFSDQSAYLQITRLIDQTLLIAFGTYFYTRLLITTNRVQFLKARWPEGIVASLG